jgi:hypothetical protein
VSAAHQDWAEAGCPDITAKRCATEDEGLAPLMREHAADVANCALMALDCMDLLLPVETEARR